MSGCSPEDYLRSLKEKPSVTCLDKWDYVGITVTSETGLLSLLAILYVLVRIVHNIRRRYLLGASLQIFRQPMDILMASLLLADVLQAIGIVQNLKWVVNGKVETGKFCDAQGIIDIFGATGVALSTLAIAVFTFLGVLVNVEASMRFTFYLIACLWTFISVLAIVAVMVNRNKDVNFMGPTPYWCWVNVGFEWKLVVEYLWLWVALGVSLLIYIPLYLWMRGNLILPQQGTAWWRFGFTRSRDVDPDSQARRSRALVMLAYPAVYCVCILPLSGVRWKTFVQTGAHTASSATFAVICIFGLSGFFNVVLLLKTRPSAGLFDLIFLHPARPPVNEHLDEAQPADVPLGRLPPGR